MVSKAQRIEIDEKILKVTGEFITNPCSMEELSEKTGISSSSCQRYLNDKRIIELLGKEVYYEIQGFLKQLKKDALSKGGYISTLNNEIIRDENGKFAGNRKIS